MVYGEEKFVSVDTAIMYQYLVMRVHVQVWGVFGNRIASAERELRKHLAGCCQGVLLSKW